MCWSRTLIKHALVSLKLTHSVLNSLFLRTRQTSRQRHCFLILSVCLLSFVRPTKMRAQYLDHSIMLASLLRGGGQPGQVSRGPGVLRGPPQKKFKPGVKRGESEQAEMGRLKTVHQTQHASSLELKCFLRGPPGPLRTPGPRLQLPNGIQDLPRAAG